MVYGKVVLIFFMCSANKKTEPFFPFYICRINISIIIHGNGLKDNFIGKDEGGQMKSKKM